MKNITSILKYATALGLLLVLSIAITLAFGGTQLMTGWLFTSFIGLNIIVGLSGWSLEGTLRDDSLVISDETYAGTSAPYYVLPALFDWDSIIKGCIYVKDGIKKKHTIPTMDFDSPLQPRKATPTQSGGDITVAARTLEPKDIMAYQEINPRNYEVHWDSEKLSQTLLTRQLPPTANNYIMMLLLGRSFEEFETMMWDGSDNYANNVNVPDTDPRFQLQFFDGFIKRFLADGSIFAVGAPVTLTAANIVSKLNALYNLVAVNNKALLKEGKYKRMKFKMSYLTAQIYEEALTETSFKNNDTTEKGIMKYKGFAIVPLAGMPDDTIVFTEATNTPNGNLWVGLNSVSDENFMLQRLQANSELFFFKMLMKIDVNYGRPEKVFLYTTKVASDYIAS